MFKLVLSTKLGQFHELDRNDLPLAVDHFEGMKLSLISPQYRCYLRVKNLINKYEKYKSNPIKRENIIYKIRRLTQHSSGLGEGFLTELFSNEQIISPLIKDFASFNTQEKYMVWDFLKHSSSSLCTDIAENVFKKAFDSPETDNWLIEKYKTREDKLAHIENRCALMMNRPFEAAKLLVRISKKNNNQEVLSPLFEALNTVLSKDEPDVSEFERGAIACSWLTYTGSRNSPTMQPVHEYIDNGLILGPLRVHALEGWGDYSARMSAVQALRKKDWV